MVRRKPLEKGERGNATAQELALVSAKESSVGLTSRPEVSLTAPAREKTVKRHRDSNVYIETTGERTACSGLE